MRSKHLIIVGAGRTGWVAAAYLRAVLDRLRDPLPEISVVGPGEPPPPCSADAAVPLIRQILSAIGIEEIDFLKRTGATFRQATRYANWLRGTGDFFYHPIDDTRAQPIDRAALDWLASDRSVAFAETVSPQPVMCELGLAPRPPEFNPAAPVLNYSYHTDSTAYADLLRQIALSRGVRHYDERVQDVERTASGDIEAVVTESGNRLSGDLYVDCTGREAALIGGQPGAEWVDCSRWLLCDRAVALSVDYAEHYPGRLPPFMTATARSAGWIQEIPLQDRKILRYIHSSRHIDEEAASKELRAFEGGHAEAAGTHSLQFSTGHRANLWSGNCVALGGAGGCIEPLASADRYLSDLGIVALAEHIPLDDDDDPWAFRFNRIMANRYDELLDFVNLHYALSQREDSEFWRDARKAERIHDRLAAKLEFWRCKAPSPSDFVDQRFPGQPGQGDRRDVVDTGAAYNLQSYEAILYGMQFLASECDEWFGSDRPPTRVPGYIISDLKKATAMLPPQEIWLRRVAGMANYSGGTTR